MKQKKIYLAIFFLAFVFLASPSISLAEGVCFKPEFPIPGFELDGAKDGCPGGKILNSTGDTIIVYINALYKYGAGLAGLMAMFMIVFAAWQWIMASGNAGKIDNAKETIRGALLGLTLLFAGNLLLSNITNRLVSFQSLDIAGIGTKYLTEDMCQMALRQNQFGSVDSCGAIYTTSTSAGFSAMCVDNTCPVGSKCWQYNSYGERIGDCPPSIDPRESVDCGCVRLTPCEEITLSNCSEYNRFSDLESCSINRCYGKTMANGQIFSAICGLSRADICLPAANSNLPGRNCSSNNECILDLDGDGVSEYCCDRENWGADECELITWVNANDGHECY